MAKQQQAEDQIYCCGAITVVMAAFSKLSQDNFIDKQASVEHKSTKAFRFDNQHHNTQHNEIQPNDSQHDSTQY